MKIGGRFDSLELVFRFGLFSWFGFPFSFLLPFVHSTAAPSASPTAALTATAAPAPAPSAAFESLDSHLSVCDPCR